MRAVSANAVKGFMPAVAATDVPRHARRIAPDPRPRCARAQPPRAQPIAISAGAARTAVRSPLARRLLVALGMRHPAVLTSLALALTAGLASTADAVTPASCDLKANANGPCFGLELTFTNDEMHEEFQREAVKAMRGQPAMKKGGPVAKKYKIAWLDAAVAACDVHQNQVCRIEYLGTRASACAAAPGTANGNLTPGDDFRVCIFGADNTEQTWFYEVTYDQAVLEINSRPTNAAWIAKLVSGGALDTLLWGFAQTAGVAADRHSGGGHIHIDVQSAFSSTTHLFNFMTRFHELRLLPLSSAMHNGHGRNATPFSLLGSLIRKQYREFAAAAVSDAKYDITTPANIKALLGDLSDQVYLYTHESPMMTLDTTDATGPTRTKYHALNTTHADIGTIEIRSIDPQQDPPDVLRMVRMFERAIAGTPASPLRILSDDIALVKDDDMTSRAPNRRRFMPDASGTPDLTKKEAEDVLRRFIEFGDFASHTHDLCALRWYMPRSVAEALDRQKVCK